MLLRNYMELSVTSIIQKKTLNDAYLLVFIERLYELGFFLLKNLLSNAIRDNLWRLQS